MPWHTYILKCSNNTYYVGHTGDLEARIKTHQSGKGSAHTAKHRPVSLVYSESFTSKPEAVKREKQIKRWSHDKKAALVNDDLIRLMELAKSRNT